MGKRINPEDLEAVSDALLRVHGAAFDTEYPAYTEQYLRARDRRRKDVSLEQIRAYNEGVDSFERDYEGAGLSIPADCPYLRDMDFSSSIDVGYLIGRAMLTSREFDIINARRGGLSYRDISLEVCCSISTVHKDLYSAYVKIRAAIPPQTKRRQILELLAMIFGWRMVHWVYG
jgi:DNA-binding CsgD family transcriptional regulator